MDKSLKALGLSKLKVADVDGERRVTFVASTASQDRDYEVVQIETFRLPLKGGGEIRVADIPEGGIDNVDMPLLTNHDLMSVEKTIGSVRHTTFENGQLIFECGISSRDYAQDVFKLIDEGHLDNSFSIQFRDFDYNFETGVCANGEIVEVSLVTRGANQDAHVLNVKNLEKGKTMEETPSTAPVETPEVVETSEVVEETPATEEVVEDTKAKANEIFGTANGDGKEHDTEVTAPVETTPEVVETPEAPAEEKVETKPTKKGKTMENIAKTLVKEEANQAVSAESHADYLSSKAAEADFAKTIAENRGQSNQVIMKAWSNKLSAKGITGDAILPSRVEQIFFKAWTDKTGILGTFRNVGANAGALYAMSGSGEGIRAKGHTKGQDKADQAIVDYRRDLKVKLIYKKLPIDLQDLIDDETGALLEFRTEELAARVAHEIATGAILGDGRSSGTPDYRVFDGTRGLYSMVADIEASSTTASYAGGVATKIEAAEGDNAYDMIIKVLAAVEDKGNGKVVVVPTGTIASLRLAKDTTGAYLFVPGQDVEAAIGAQVFEMDFGSSDYKAIAYANQGYAIFGGQDFVRTDYDLTKNQDVMLYERAVAGSAYGYKAVAGIVEASE